MAYRGEMTTGNTPERNTKYSPFFDFLAKNSLDEEANILDITKNQKLHQEIISNFGGEKEYHEIAHDKIFMAEIFDNLANHQKSELTKISLLNLLKEIIDDLFLEGDETKCVILLNQLKTIADDPRQSLFIKSAIYSLLITSGRAAYFPELKTHEHFINNFSVDSYRHAEYENLEINASPTMTEVINGYDKNEPIVSPVSHEYLGLFSDSGTLVGLSTNLTPKNEITFSNLDENTLPSFNNKIRTEEDVALIKQMLSIPFRESMKELFNINLAEYSLAIQLRFLDFLRSSTSQDFETIKKFLDEADSKENRRQRLTAFLAMDADYNNGKKIININEKFSLEESNKIFAKISSIVEFADKQNQELFEELGIGLTGIDLNEFRFLMIKKADELIDNLDNSQRTVEELLNKLEKIKTEIIVLYSVLKSGKGKITLEQIKNISLEIKTTLSPEEIKKILKMAEENWQQIPAMQKMMVEGLKNALEDNEKEQEFCILKYQGEIIGFWRFEKIDDKAVYAWSFNVLKDLHGLRIAEQSMLASVKQKAQEKIVRGASLFRLGYGINYIEKAGFVGTGYIENYHETGEPTLEIEIDFEKNKNYQYRQENDRGEVVKTEGEIINEWKNNNYQIGQAAVILKYDFGNSEDSRIFQEQIKELLGEKKYVITRYFSNKKEPGDMRYLVLEKV